MMDAIYGPQSAPVQASGNGNIQPIQVGNKLIDPQTGIVVGDAGNMGGAAPGSNAAASSYMKSEQNSDNPYIQSGGAANPNNPYAGTGYDTSVSGNDLGLDTNGATSSSPGAYSPMQVPGANGYGGTGAYQGYASQNQYGGGGTYGGSLYDQMMATPNNGSFQRAVDGEQYYNGINMRQTPSIDASTNINWQPPPTENPLSNGEIIQKNLTDIMNSISETLGPAPQINQPLYNSDDADE